MLKNIGFFALGIIIAAVAIYAYKKMSNKTTTTGDGGMGMGGDDTTPENDQNGTGGN